MSLREAAQQALEALIEAARILGATQAKKGFGLYTSEDGRLEQVLHESLAKHSNTLRTALAEPETEAETYKRLYELRGKALERPCFHCGYKPKKIYPMEQRTEPEQEPLTDEEIELLAIKHAPPIDPAFAKDDDFIEFARAIERAHGIGGDA